MHNQSTGQGPAPAVQLTEKELLDSSAKLLEAQRLTKVGDLFWDVETGKVTCSGPLYEMLGYEASEHIDYDLVDSIILHPDDRERVSRWLNDGIASGSDELPPFEYRVIRNDGEALYVRTVGRILHQPGKKPVIFATVQDITEHKETEERIRRSALRLKAMVDILQFRAQGVQDFLDYALDKAIELTGSKIGYIYFYDAEHRQFRLNSWSKNVMKQCGVVDPGNCYELGNTGIWAEAVRQGRPIRLNDFQAQHPLKRGYPAGHVSLSRFLTVPVFFGGMIVAVVGVANKDSDYGETDELELSLLMNGVWKSVEALRSEEALRRIEWLLTPKPTAPREASLPPYGDLTALNTAGPILKTVGPRVLADVVADFLDLLDSSAKVYEKNGDYALNVFSSGWCRFLNAASRRRCGSKDNGEALAGGKWLCHEYCWTGASKAAIETGRPVDNVCGCDLRIHAVPIRAGAEIVGSINFCYGDPPRGRHRLRELAACFGVDIEELLLHAEAYESRPPFIIEVARKRLASSARLLGEMVQRRRTEEALREREQQYRYLFETNPHPMWVYDLETLRFLEVNRIAIANYGYTREEFLRMTIKDIRPPEDVPALLENIARITSGIDQAGVWRHRRQDGSIIFVEVTSHTLKFAGRNAELVLAQDVTERQRATEALRSSEEKFRSLFANHAAVKFIIDPDSGDIVDANEAAAEFYGWPLEELKRMNITRINTLPAGQVRQEIQKARGRKNTRFKFQHRKADGSIADVDVCSSRVNIGGREYLHSIIFDITRQCRLEEQYRQAQKMESVGRLAGGVAHDFNNMLSVIMGNAEIAMGKVDKADPLHDDLREIFQAARYSADITRQLLAFARKQAISPRVLDLNDTVQGMLKMLRRLIGENIDLAWLANPNIRPVKIDPSQIDQILANLCVNARDAIAGTGRITIRTGNAVIDEAYCADRADAAPGDYVQLQVSDSGCGMDRALLDNIFDPFFTTKDNGTGLGLATVYGIVKQNGGFVDVSSEPGRGTTFTVYLPCHDGEPDAAEKIRVEDIPARTSETVLLVEDEVPLLEITRRILESLGYTVLGAESPSRALELAGEHAGRIGVLLTDMIMPEMNGRDLAARVTALCPGIRVLCMSGYAADFFGPENILEPGMNFLQKPFTRNDLAAKMGEVLGKE